MHLEKEAGREREGKGGKGVIKDCRRGTGDQFGAGELSI
jgi:hypothetical protein